MVIVLWTVYRGRCSWNDAERSAESAGKRSSPPVPRLLHRRFTTFIWPTELFVWLTRANYRSHNFDQTDPRLKLTRNKNMLVRKLCQANRHGFEPKSTRDFLSLYLSEIKTRTTPSEWHRSQHNSGSNWPWTTRATYTDSKDPKRLHEKTAESLTRQILHFFANLMKIWGQRSTLK